MKLVGVKKALYIFLTALLGVLLFLTVQRSLSLIVVLLLNLDYARYSLGTNPLQIHALNYVSIMLAVFFGGWYGVWLGLHWYEIVYEKGSGGLLHGLTSSWFSSDKKSSPVKIVEKPKAVEPSVKVQSSQRGVDSIGSSGAWDFEDILLKRKQKPVSMPEPELDPSFVEKKVASPVRKRKAVAKTSEVTKKRSSVKAKTKVAA